MFKALCRSFIVVGLFAASACSSDSSNSDDGDGSGDNAEQATTGDRSLFGDNCPTDDEATARAVDDSNGYLDGLRAVGAAGDTLIANDQAAFVISAPVTDETPQRTWWHYGGIVVDAAAVNDCAQGSPDQIDEIAFVIGQLDIASFASSSLRGFRADKVEVINDGSDGQAAVVRATGTDDTFQLIEYQLVRLAAEGGNPKPLTSPLGIAIEVDYTLEPGDAVLTIDYRVIAENDAVLPMLGAAIVSWGDDIDKFSRAESELPLGGFGVGLDMPWQGAQGNEGSYAFAVADAQQGIASISGVEAFIDAGQALGDPLNVPAAGDNDEMRFLLAVSPTDTNTAVGGLAAHDGDLAADSIVSAPVAGTVVDSSGEPIANARIDIEISRPAGDWGRLDTIVTDDAGVAAGELVIPTNADGSAPAARLRIKNDGRDDLVVPVDLTDPTAATDATWTVGPRGVVAPLITDIDGREIPARLTFVRPDGTVAYTDDTPGSGEMPVIPGDYELIISRGFEYSRDISSITVPPDGTLEVNATLERVVDTDGWIAIDTHVHSAPSPDSTLRAERRSLDAAATGLEVIVNTNHEIIEDLSDAITGPGLDPWVTSITGQEVTASSPEHTTMFPVEPDGSARGGIPLWYGLDLGEIYQLEADRGATIRGLNHPTEYLQLIGWDYTTASPTNTDPALLGLDEGSEVWSWDFEQFELQNGRDRVLRSDKDDKGLFDFWQGAINHGHRIVGVAATDAHGLGVGEVWTYVKVDNDDPATITPEEISQAIIDGRAIASTGAFADVSIEGAGPGDTASAGNSTELAVSVRSAPGIDVTSLMVFQNCDLVATVGVDSGPSGTNFDESIPLDLPIDANITVLGFGTEAMALPWGHDDADRVPRFVTNPIYVDVDGNGAFDPPGDKPCDYEPADAS